MLQWVESLEPPVPLVAESLEPPVPLVAESPVPLVAESPEPPVPLVAESLEPPVPLVAGVLGCLTVSCSNKEKSTILSWTVELCSSCAHVLHWTAEIQEHMVTAHCLSNHSHHQRYPFWLPRCSAFLEKSVPQEVLQGAWHPSQPYQAGSLRQS